MQNVPLTAAKQRELVAVVRSGGPDSTSAANMLIEANEGLCRSVVAALQSHGGELDEDLLQTARVAVFKAIYRYRAGGASFSTFAYRVAVMAVRKAIRRERRYTTHYVTAHSWDSVQRRTRRRHCITADEPTISSIVDRLALRSEFARLDPDDQQLMWRIYWQDKSQAEIAIESAMSHTTISKRHRRILKALRAALAQ